MRDPPIGILPVGGPRARFRRGGAAQRTTVVLETRIHGRGGQGVVTAAELLSVAAFDDGQHAQAFPSFGSERTGAPVVSFCRIDEKPIRSREPILDPGGVIIIDPTLLRQVNVLGGLGPDGYVLINSSHTLPELHLQELLAVDHPERRCSIPATELAREHLGRPLPNVALLGAYAALTEVVSLRSLLTAIRERFPGEVGERNVAAATAAHQLVRPTGPRAALPETVDA